MTKLKLSTFIFLAFFTSAHAQFGLDEVRAGVLAQSCCGYSPDDEQGVGVNLEAVFKSPRFLSFAGSPRPVIGGTIATDSDATSHAYAAMEWRADIKRAFIGGHVGAAVHNGEVNFDPAVDLARDSNTLFLGCRVLFKLGADVGYRLTKRVSAGVHWSHISNAGICDENEGLDQLGLRLGFDL